MNREDVIAKAAWDNGCITIAEELAFIKGAHYDEDNPAWRMCEDGVPPKNDDFLVVDEYNNIFIAFWQDDEWIDDSGYPNRDVIAWLPLPKFNPKAEKEWKQHS